MDHLSHIKGIAELLVAIGTGVGLLYGFLRWAGAGITAFKGNTKFVQDMGTNHLPHIYAELTHISYKLGEEPKPAPPIKFVD